jgi:1-acyl-sn-glycerol-3-phosphate acyltransferase
MVDLEYMNNIKLAEIPHFQQFIGHLFLGPNYRLIANVDIQFENIERIPKDKNIIFAMNHTDRFNYWPFQYKLWALKVYPYTTVWVKGKYYRNDILAKLLNWCNLIPVPSMGYLIEEFFAKKVGRRIERDEYRAIKDVIEGNGDENHSATQKGRELAAKIDENFIEFISPYYQSIMERVAELSKIALLEKNLNIIIFPEGTRSTKLGEGRTGLAQLALNTGTTIVPVGCNNTDSIYPGSSPIAKSGNVIYRVGEPLSFDGKLKDFRINEEFKLFSAESRMKYKEKFDEVTRIVMENINNLVDERYRT